MADVDRSIIRDHEGERPRPDGEVEDGAAASRALTSMPESSKSTIQTSDPSSSCGPESPRAGPPLQALLRARTRKCRTSHSGDRASAGNYAIGGGRLEEDVMPCLVEVEIALVDGSGHSAAGVDPDPSASDAVSMSILVAFASSSGVEQYGLAVSGQSSGATQTWPARGKIQSIG